MTNDTNDDCEPERDASIVKAKQCNTCNKERHTPCLRAIGMIVGKAAILDPIDDPSQQLCRENKQQGEAKCKDASSMCEPGTDRNPAIKPGINPPIILPQRLSHTTKTASNDPIKNVGNKRPREPDDEPGT